MRRLTITLVTLFAVASTADAQDSDRRDRHEPELVVEAGGRTGTCDDLGFSQDGKFLFAAGDDKVVRVWPAGPDGIDVKGMKTLRWPVWREQRGGIKTIAVSPDGTRVFVGGYGTITSNVYLIDQTKGEFGEVVAHAIPKGQGRVNYFSVMTSAFRPDGKEVAFGTADGSLWVWDLVGEPKWVAQHKPIDRPGGRKEFNRPRLVFYRNGKLISVAQGGDVREDDPAGGPNGRVLTTVHPTMEAWIRAYRAIPSADRRWIVVSANGPAVSLIDLDSRTAKLIQLKKGEFPRSVAISRDDKLLAVGVGSLVSGAEFHIEADHRIDLYPNPLAAESPEPRPGPDHHYRAEAMAFDDRGRLAIAGGDNHEVTVWELGDRQRAVSTALGFGRNLWTIRVSKSGQSFGFQAKRDAASFDPNRRGTGPWHTYSLQTGKLLREVPDWLEPITTADGWRVDPKTGSKYVWHVVRRVNGRDLPPLAIPLDPDRDEAPQCYTFLPATDGRPTRLIVGHYYGCTVFELADDRVKKLMRCVGHSGEVTSVAPGPDLDWFVTCGADQTVAGWSLNDWPTHPGLGTVFARKDGKLIVGEVDIGSPAWEMGLVKGDEVQFAVVGATVPAFNVSGKYEKPYGERKEITDAAVARLASVQPGVELYLGWRRAGFDKFFEQSTTLPRRPLWKLFPAFNNQEQIIDHVFWIWKTSHYYSTTNGDYLVGWHLNGLKEGSSPRFHKAAHFRKVFSDPLVVINLLSKRDYAATLRTIQQKNPNPISLGAQEPPPVLVTAENPVPKADAVTVQVALRQRGSNPDLMPERIELWVNDFRFKTWGPQPTGLDEPVAIPVDKLRAGQNVVTVQTFNRLGGRVESQVRIDNPKRPSRPRLLGVTIGVNDYAGSGKNADGARQVGDNLKTARKDAEDLRKQLAEYGGGTRFFTNADLAVLPDGAAQRAAILKRLDDLAAKTGPDDQVVIFLAGHGDFVEVERKDGQVEKIFVFCCPNYDRANYKETGVAADELLKKLAAIPGRKLVLLDACHSGQAAAENIIRSLVPTGQGPTVIAACDQSEYSFENEKIGNGLFTLAVLEALGKNFDQADTNDDDALGADEIFEYVRNRLPELLKQIGKQPYAQNPICFPPDPSQMAIVRKTTK